VESVILTHILVLLQRLKYRRENQIVQIPTCSLCQELCSKLQRFSVLSCIRLTNDTHIGMHSWL